MAKLNESQKRYKILFENHVNSKSGHIFDKEFERDILKLRALGDGMKHRTVNGKGWSKYPPLMRFIWKHKLALPMYDFLYHFAIDGTIDFTEIRTGLSIECNEAGTKLLISPDATKKQIISFINDNWSDIQTAQYHDMTPLYPDGKIQSHFNAERDYRMLELAETMNLNDVAAKIAQEYRPYSPTPRDISKIKHRLKKRSIPI